ncbi:pseudouridine synthase [Candidatus Uhrbacteria bacterium]|nr:pseudouridine synthase [Candidatus Uhrbacteria bacterium]
MEPVRLNKFLVSSGVCSRREADRLIEAGKVRVDGRAVGLGEKVQGNETIMVNGQRVSKQPSRRVYLAYHKPVGIICTGDPNARDNIIEAVGYPERLFHIGRLDVASSGLILLTNDGDIVNRILRSEGRHEKEYVVRLARPLNQTFLRHMAEGVVFDGRKTLPARVARMGTDLFSIVLVEGRNRQIRRMCETLGYEVKALKRIRVMHITLDNLPPGAWRHLTPEEEERLMKALA